MESYKRATRVGELIQQEISKIVLDLKEPRLGFITITGIKLTDDLKTARVLYSIIGNEEEVKANCELMEGLLPEIRHQLAIRLNLRRTPELVLKYDDTSEKANRIFELLEKIDKEEHAAE